MATTPTVRGLAAELATVQTQLADLADRVAALEKWAGEINKSDVASGWARWREEQKKPGGPT